mmetsp:Transcript_20463/g.44421  ORF Transcript_20463/g.44421 Transcript_20463/m.44421 type:complete len:402 (-) Transcript_20463:484-1689(-)
MMTTKALLLLTISTQLVGAVCFVTPCILSSRAMLAVSKTTAGGQKLIRLADDSNLDHGLDDGTSEMIDCGGRRLFLSSLAASSALLGLPVSPAYAAKGAAEYDLEYYMRDLFMGNKLEGNLPVSNAPPPHPPRTLQGQLVPLLIDDELETCIAIQELAQITKTPISILAEQTRAVRTKVQPAFKSSHPWEDELVRDEYFFDLTCYAFWRVASAAIPTDYNKRDQFTRNIGRSLLNEIMSRGLISKKSIDTLQSSSSSQKAIVSLTDTVPCIIEILNLFQSTNYCTNYRLGDKNDEERTGLGVFDSLDDEEISSPSGGGSVNCLVSVFDPSTLGGALQITGEGSRFAPDFVGPTLAAVWELVGGDGVAAVSFESYFVDPVYRPNPKDFFPNERFYQFTIARK